jgi:hypothetical protein
LHTEHWLCNLPGRALKVPVVGGWVVGGWVVGGWWLKVNLVISFG